MGSGFLFPMPGIMSGMARSADLWGMIDDYNISPDGQIADAIAIWNDWKTVGSDLAEAMESSVNPKDQLPLFDEAANQ